jgi:hypothetical protein
MIVVAEAAVVDSIVKSVYPTRIVTAANVAGK